MPDEEEEEEEEKRRAQLDAELRAMRDRDTDQRTQRQPEEEGPAPTDADRRAKRLLDSEQRNQAEADLGCLCFMIMAGIGALVVALASCGTFR